jgi:hypothetical protein
MKSNKQAILKMPKRRKIQSLMLFNDAQNNGMKETMGKRKEESN